MNAPATEMARTRAGRETAADIALLLPFYNEEAYLARTLETLAAQERPAKEIILVDNGSTDRSAEIAESMRPLLGAARVVLLSEPEPGKIHALERGLDAVTCPYVALCDADTLYPPRYLETALALFAADADVVALLATDLYSPPGSARALLKRLKIQCVSRLFPRQCHSGGYGQIFRTDALRACGGFSSEHWPFVLEDHEIIHRLLRFGRIRHPFPLWCHPADRRTAHARTRWSLQERVLYHLTPFAMKDWYFYRFLWHRWAKRDLGNVRLRQRNWA